MWQGKKTSLEAAIFKNIKERDIALQKLNKIHLKK
jgi:hypothetical protein